MTVRQPRLRREHLVGAVRRWRRLSRWARRGIAAAAVLVIVAGLVIWTRGDGGIPIRTEDRLLTVSSGPAGNEPVTLDTRRYIPETADRGHPVPAVLLGHGFGGTKLSVESDAKELAHQGYEVLTWTARGFGRSTGQIHLDSPDYEVNDARRLVDWLARQPEVQLDRPGDPRLGVAGGSYGGALALLLAAYDHRVDALAPQVTWHDLADSLVPNQAVAPTSEGSDEPTTGVFKKAWAGSLFLAAFGGTDLPGTEAAADNGSDGVSAPQVNPDPACGRFALDVCRAYQQLATAGRADPATLALLRRSSPASVLDRISAPTLLVQGMADSLFPLSEADANARGIAAHGTPVRVAWYSGGHDGQASPADDDRVKFLTLQWFDHFLRHRGADPGRSFTYSRVTGFDVRRDELITNGYRAGDYPGLAAAGTTVEILGPPQSIGNPPGGNPAAISSLPGGRGTPGLGNFAEDVPGQAAVFGSEQLTRSLDVVGASSIRLRVASSSGTAVLFVKLYDVGSDRPTLPAGLVAPVRLTGLPRTPEQAAQAPPVTVQLPGIVYRFAPGHQLRVVVASTDQGYATPTEPALYTIALDGPLTVPQVPGTAIPTQATVWRYVLAGVIALVVVGVLVALGVARWRRRRRVHLVQDEFAGTPLVVRGLRKAYADGFVAVREVGFTVRPGQVVGLLGPNGAGKTTTLRVLLGLIKPTAGEVLVFGHRLLPGSPVLARLGALVEGPGFLPHLSGLANLKMYWSATGRPTADAHLDEVLEIAALGDAIHRKVKTYSHGMKQRLAIAQAMLGLPDLLVLDEPTDGLDPPQIAEMRRVMQRYASAPGRAVLVSSHLLAEVEQTCTDVVVMHRGALVASGPVDDVVGDSPTVLVDVSDPVAAEPVLRDLPGVRSVERQGTGLVVDLDGTPRRAMVEALVAAGIGVDRMVPRRRLEDAFLALVSGDSR